MKFEVEGQEFAKLELMSDSKQIGQTFLEIRTILATKYQKLILVKSQKDTALCGFFPLGKLKWDSYGNRVILGTPKLQRKM